MEDYNIEKLDSTLNGTPATSGRKPNYVITIIAAFGTSVIVGILLAVIGILLKSEYWIALVVGAVIVSSVIKHFVPGRSVAGAIIGAIFTPLAYLIYQFVMLIYGYSYEDGSSWFWILLIGSVALGAYMGYNNSDNN